MDHPSSDSAAQARSARGFTMIEMMLSMTVLAVLMIVVTSALDQTEKVLKNSKAKADQFRDARLAFELITRNLSQASLQTYSDYYYSATGTNQPPPDASSGPLVPSAYVRQSDLQFLVDATPQILGSATTVADHPGHGVFFQAALGQTVTYTGLNNLLNGRGYYVEFGNDQASRPDFLSTATTPLRYRYRLLEYQPPSEQVTSGSVNFVGDGIYATPATWYQQNRTDASRAVADNILLLVLSPQVTADMATTAGRPATWLAPNYRYNSLDADNSTPKVDGITLHADGTVNQGTRNLLPPLVTVTMVAIDEASAQRWAADMNNQPVDFLTDAGASFSSATLFTQDLNSLKVYLSGLRLNYRVFSTTVALRNARWDSSQF